MYRKLLLAAAVFVATDVALGTLAFRLLPDKIDEAEFRISSPVYHHDLRPYFRGTAQWGAVRYPIRIDSLGMKDAEAIEVPRVTKDWRILLLGDSFTEGVGFAFEDTFAGIIASALRPRGVSVLNGGVVSYAPTIYERKTRWLVEDAAVQIDEVVVFLDISDIEDEASHYALDARGNVADQSEQAARFHEPVEMPSWTSRAKRFLREHSLSLQVLDTIKDRLTGAAARAHPAIPPDAHLASDDPLAPWAEPLANPRGAWTNDPVVFERWGRRGLERAGEALARLDGFLRARGKGLTLVVYPWPHQIVAGERDSIQERHWREWCAARGVAFVDLFPVFVDGRAPAVVIPELFIPGDVHLNGEGNRRVASAFLERFRPRVSAQREPVPPQPHAQRD